MLWLRKDVEIGLFVGKYGSEMLCVQTKIASIQTGTPRRHKPICPYVSHVNLNFDLPSSFLCDHATTINLFGWEWIFAKFVKNDQKSWFRTIFVCTFSTSIRILASNWGSNMWEIGLDWAAGPMATSVISGWMTCYIAGWKSRQNEKPFCVEAAKKMTHPAKWKSDIIDAICANAASGWATSAAWMMFRIITTSNLKTSTLVGINRKSIGREMNPIRAVSQLVSVIVWKVLLAWLKSINELNFNTQFARLDFFLLYWRFGLMLRATK